MKISFVMFFVIIFLSSSFGQAQTQKNTWCKIYGGSSGGRFFSVSQTDDGSFMLVGDYIFGPTWPNYTQPAGTNTWLIKTDSSGETTLDKKFDSGLWENPRELFQTSNGDYIVVCTDDSIFRVLKIDASGNIVWHEIFNGVLSGVAQSNNGDFAVIARPQGSTDSVCIYKFNASDLQAPAWTKLVTINNESRIAGVIATNDGGFAVAGDYFSYWTGELYTYSTHAWLVKFDNQGNIQLNYLFENSTLLNSFIGTEDGGYLLADGTNIKKTDSNMNVQWTKTLALESEPTATSITSIIRTDDGYALAVIDHKFTTEKSVVGLVKIDNSGDMQWNKWYNATWVHKIIQTKDGGYALVGEKELGWYDVSIGWNAGNYGIFIKTDANGNAEGEITRPTPTTSPTPQLSTPTVAPTNQTLPSPSTSISPSSSVGQLFENPFTAVVLVVLITCTVLGLVILLTKKLRKAPQQKDSN